MPEKKTIERAKKDKREGKSPSTQAGEFVREKIHHIREGKHGAKNAKQAIAIGLSKARRSGVKLSAPKKGTASKRTRTQAKRDLAKGKKRSSTKRPSAKRSAGATDRCRARRVGAQQRISGCGMVRREGSRSPSRDGERRLRSTSRGTARSVGREGAFGRFPLGTQLFCHLRPTSCGPPRSGRERLEVPRARGASARGLCTRYRDGVWDSSPSAAAPASASSSRRPFGRAPDAHAERER